MTDAPQALYRMYDSTESLLYVGVSLNVAQRFAQHRSGKSWWLDIATVRLEHYPTRLDVLAAERKAIQTEGPRYNIVGVCGMPDPLAFTGPSDAELAEERALTAEMAAALNAATAERHAAEEELTDARHAEASAALDAVLAGTKQAEVARITGYTREHVRRITDAVRDERGIPRPLPQRPEQEG